MSTLGRSAIYSHGYRLWISLYFVTFYILAVIVMCNLLIALIVVRHVCGGVGNSTRVLHFCV